MWETRGGRRPVKGQEAGKSKMQRRPPSPDSSLRCQLRYSFRLSSELSMRRFLPGQAAYFVLGMAYWKMLGSICQGRFEAKDYFRLPEERVFFSGFLISFFLSSAFKNVRPILQAFLQSLGHIRAKRTLHMAALSLGATYSNPGSRKK